MLTIKELEKKIISARDDYYNKSISEITDAEYDELIDQLRMVDPNNNLLFMVGSPVKVTEWKKEKHNTLMTSLNKVNTEEEFVDWCKYKETIYTVGHKFDGINMDLQYISDTLIKAITRGDGIEGEDVYRNVFKIPSIPYKINHKCSKNTICTIDIGGEIYLTYDNFNKINEIKKNRGDKKLFSNPRNAASGIIKSFDGEFCKYLSFTAYKLNGLPGIIFEKEAIEFLTEIGFETIGSFIGWGEKNIIIEIYNKYCKELRSQLDYDIDGLVIKINDLRVQRELGTLNGNPKGQVAWKFGPIQKPTKVKSIEWSAGRNGRITPVAILESVNLGGVNVTRTSLHNLDIFKSLNLAKNDVVIVSRRNDVIPYIEGVQSRSGNKPFELPKNCPVCNSELDIVGEFLICSNSACKSLDIGTIMKWIEATNIMNIGEATVEKFYEMDVIKTPVDLYTVSVDILALTIGSTMAIKIKKNIEDHKVLKLTKFIDGLNINNFGEGLTEKLENAGYKTIDYIINITIDELLKIDGIKEKTAERIYNGLINKAKLITELRKHVTILTKEDKMNILSKISGKSFCFTGGLVKLDNNGKPITRKVAWDMVINHGGTICKSVTKGLDYLVQADPNSTSVKTTNAIKNGTTILGEEDFWKMIE
jgi:DNA ligase (NAD+)